jgi:DNA-binding transcriptional MerR regulator
METFTIGQVAERSGFPASTLRYYEQHGLIEPVGRTGAGYRLYDERSLARLELIGRAKQLGCTLEEITDLTELWDAEDCAPAQARLRALVDTKIAEARARGAELISRTAQLQTAAAHLDGGATDGPCGTACGCMEDGPIATTPAFAATSTARPTSTVLTTAVELAEPSGEQPIACTLAADRIPGRAREWWVLLDHVERRSRTDDGGLRLELGPTTPVDELTRLALAEQGCCAFFAFAITVDHRGLALEVRAPAEASDLVAAVFGSAA